MNKKVILKLVFLDLGPQWDKIKDFTFLSLRVIVALSMLSAHGYGKLIHFSDKAPHFPDPLGLGSFLSLFLVTGAEFFGSILLAVGLLTRWSALSLCFTMCVAAFIADWGEPFAEKELAILYALLFGLFLVFGGGKYSMDHIIRKKF